MVEQKFVRFGWTKFFLDLVVQKSLDLVEQKIFLDLVEQNLELVEQKKFSDLGDKKNVLDLGEQNVRIGWTKI